MKRAFIFAICIFCFSSLLTAQTDESITDEGDDVTSEEGRFDDPAVEESYNMWADPLYYQFEKMMPALARSVGRLDNRVSTLAVTELDFSQSLDKSFRKVASAKLYGQLLIENPRLKLIKCNECNMIRSELKSGILTVSRGIANQEGRKQLALKLGVQGFMTAIVIEEERQLTIVVNVYDAQEGRIILSDVITGEPVPKTTYWNAYLGQMTFPVNLFAKDSTTDTEKLVQSAIIGGIEQSVRFSESWLLLANFGFFYDNNEKLGDQRESFTFPSFLLDGSLGWEVFAFMNNNASLTMLAGIGQIISMQFSFPTYGKFGFKAVIGQRLTFSYFAYSLQLSNEGNLTAPNDNDKAPQLLGSASSISLGFQW